MNKVNFEENNKIIQRYINSIKQSDQLYVNYPFCFGRCRYCIYHLYRFSNNSNNIFLESFKKEIQLYKNFIKKPCFKELHIGGGTPNLVPPHLLLEPLKSIIDLDKVQHFTVEVFPTSKLEQYLHELKRYHISKIILGVQTLDENILRNEHRPTSQKKHRKLFKNFIKK